MFESQRSHTSTKYRQSHFLCVLLTFLTFVLVSNIILTFNFTSSNVSTSILNKFTSTEHFQTTENIGLKKLVQLLPVHQTLPDVVSPFNISNKNYLELSFLRQTSSQYTITQSEKQLWFDNKLFVFNDKSKNIKFGFCSIEKNSCTMFKQIFKRIKGYSNYLDTKPTRIHYQPFEGLMDESFLSVEQLSTVLQDKSFYLAAFVRDPLERLVSAYVDKCSRQQGINLCNYARWSSLFKGDVERLSKRIYQSPLVPQFFEWIDGIINCPCWPEPDKHVAPQNNFCNLYQFYHRFDIFRFENNTHRKIWMERANIWEKFGSSGWATAEESIVNYTSVKTHSTNSHRQNDYYVRFYAKNVNVTAAVINAYRDDYIIFGMQMPTWICHKSIEKTQKLKRALRSLPRTLRPSCLELEWLWIPP